MDPGKVALGGWSNGAMSMLWTVDVAAPQRPAGLAHDFRAAFGFYPGCITLKKRRPDYTAAMPGACKARDRARRRLHHG